MLFIKSYLYVYIPAYKYNLVTTDNEAVQSTSPGLMSLNGGNQGHFGGIWICPLTDLWIYIYEYMYLNDITATLVNSIEYTVRANMNCLCRLHGVFSTVKIIFEL